MVGVGIWMLTLAAYCATSLVTSLSLDRGQLIDYIIECKVTLQRILGQKSSVVWRHAYTQNNTILRLIDESTELIASYFEDDWECVRIKVAAQLSKQLKDCLLLENMY